MIYETFCVCVHINFFFYATLLLVIIYGWWYIVRRELLVNRDEKLEDMNKRFGK